MHLIEVNEDHFNELKCMQAVTYKKLKNITDDIVKRGFESFDKEFPIIAKARKMLIETMKSEEGRRARSQIK